MDDIREKLSQADESKPAESADHTESTQSLQDAIWRLEESHPTLTSLLGDLADALGRTIR